MEKLPPEIWLTIFPNLTARDLQACTLTCKQFRVLAQPLLFNTLDVTPFFLSLSHSPLPNTPHVDQNLDISLQPTTTRHHQPILRRQSYLAYTRSRLEYYTKPHISPSVHHIWISPYPRSSGLFPARDHRDDLNPDLVIDAVIKVLHQFPNLLTLSWHCVDLKREWWDVVKGLGVKHVWMNSTAIMPGLEIGIGEVEMESEMGISELALDQWAWQGRATQHVSIHEERAPGVDRRLLSQLVNPSTIRRITVPRADTACSVLDILSDRFTSSLTALRIPFGVAITEQTMFISALSNCPNLDDLRILPPSDFISARSLLVQHKHDNLFPPYVLTNLTTYQGPSIFLPLRPFLTDISLYGLDAPPALGYPAGLAAVLHWFADNFSHTALSLPLERLHLSTTRISRSLIDSLVLFPALKVVSIESHDASEQSILRDAWGGQDVSDVDFVGEEEVIEDGDFVIRHGSTVNSLYLLLQHTRELPPLLHTLRLATRLSNANLDADTQTLEAAKVFNQLGERWPSLDKVEVGYGAGGNGYSVGVGLVSGTGDDSDATGEDAIVGHEPGTVGRSYVRWVRNHTEEDGEIEDLAGKEEEDGRIGREEKRRKKYKERDRDRDRDKTEGYEDTVIQSSSLSSSRESSPSPDLSLARYRPRRTTWRSMRLGNGTLIFQQHLRSVIFPPHMLSIYNMNHNNATNFSNNNNNNSNNSARLWRYLGGRFGMWWRWDGWELFEKWGDLEESNVHNGSNHHVAGRASRVARRLVRTLVG